MLISKLYSLVGVNITLNMERVNSIKNLLKQNLLPKKTNWDYGKRRRKRKEKPMFGNFILISLWALSLYLLKPRDCDNVYKRFFNIERDLSAIHSAIYLLAVNILVDDIFGFRTIFSKW
jgi:hypothetical protein